MVTVEMMVGVLHGREGMFSDIPLKLSKDLQNALRGLPKGSTVGIEYCPEIEESFTVFGEERQFSDSTIAYWQQVIQFCENLGLHVVYLDDIDLLVRSSKELIRGHELLYRRDSQGVVSQKIYRSWVLSDVLLNMRRERVIFGKIKQEQPNAVLLGKGHADIFSLNPHLLHSRGIEVNQFFTEDVSEENRFTPRFVDQPNKDEVFERKLLIRKYNSLKYGRIKPKGVPDYIGYWQYPEQLPPMFISRETDLGTPQGGLFEVYLDENGKTGKIFDNLGDATVEGFTIFEKSDVTFLSFEKTYLPERAVSAVRGTMKYDAEVLGDVINGAYEYRWNSGPFLMRKFQPGMKVDGKGVFLIDPS